VITIGIDPHKASHTAVALDPEGRVLGELRAAATRTTTERLLRWAERWPDRIWAVEGTSGLGRLLAQQLTACDQAVLDVPATLAARGSTLTTIFGISEVLAAKILGDVGRFASADCFASYSGTAPIEVSSGEVTRHRLSRNGNRSLNSALHLAARVQTMHPGLGRDHYERKLAEHKSSREALRSLKRQLAKVVYRRLVADQVHRLALAS
jgi:transposase